MEGFLENRSGVLGVIRGTIGGEVRTAAGNVASGETIAAVAAALTGELQALGATLGLGTLTVVTLKAAAASRVFARHAGATLAIELDPMQPLGELESTLRSGTWAFAKEEPPIHRLPTAPVAGSSNGTPVAAVDEPASSQERERSTRTTRPGPMASANQPSSGSGPVFSGELEELSLPDLLEFMRHGQRSGLLVCTSTTGIGTVQLSRGMIVSADSPHAIDLREYLLCRPDLAPDQRRELTDLPIECFGDDAIERALLSRELMPRDEIDGARIARIHSACREMMEWTSGRFSFDPSVVVLPNSSLALSTQSVLLHICQELDEQQR